MGLWIDSHCHLEKFVQQGALAALLERAAADGVGRLITVGTSMRDWNLYAQLAEQYRGQVDYTVGLHPCDVEDDWRDHVTALPTFFTNTVAPVALGEIGLDHFHLPKDADEAARVKAQQEDAFRAQLEIAHQLGCPVVIHSRNCFADCVRVLRESGVDWSQVVFHCFADGAEEMQQLAALGGRASFTGIVTYKNAESVRQAVLEQGLDRLMIETDSPYLAPVPMRGKPNEPAYVRHTGEYLAELFGIPPEELAARTSANAKAFFGLA